MFQWGLRLKSSDKLGDALNSWIAAFKTTSDYNILYAKYFRRNRSEKIIQSDYYALSTGKVSPWDYQIKSFSDSLKWDWRLLASLICQESHFDPTVVSWAGAVGLMQIMPQTGRNFGIDINASPENNMKAGVMYINYLQKYFSNVIPDSTERLKFVLAAYNAGAGNIVDAMKLADKNGKDPHLWDDNVAVWLLKKSEPKYYNDPVVENGYCRGDESVNFVMRVLERYSEYKNIMPVQKN
jgi:membrane-bound lytic murein transglycosylase F